jgi:ADP-ribosylglycohydrolase
LGLKPGQEVALKITARWVSGHNRLAIAFDKMSLTPVPGFGPDDDTTYQIIGLHALKEYGPNVTSEQIAKEWLQHLHVPETSMLAEAIALRNIRDGVMPPASGKHSSSEAIGGQMKAEIWGLVCPGNPAKAAEYGRVDGVVAHAGNGAYGEMFMAAVMAESFTLDAASWKGDTKRANDEIRRLLSMGLSQIPPDCEYAAVVKWVMQMHQDGLPWREAMRRIVAKYPKACNPVFGDAGIVTLGLLYGDGDFEKSICITAMCGQDTDCDTASVGAVLGCLHGAGALPAKWTEPLGDTFRCGAKDMTTWKISDLASEICRAGMKVTPAVIRLPPGHR